MATIPTKFHVLRGYAVIASNMLRNSVVAGSFRDDSPSGKISAEARAAELQKQHDEERKAEIKTKGKR